MHRLIFALVVFSLIGIGSASAQQGNPAQNYDFESPMYTVVDLASKAWFSGWSGNCNTGRLPVSFMLWRVDAQKQIVNVPITVTTGPRADASDWLNTRCQRPFELNLGWSLVPVQPEPEGVFTYVILVTDVPASWTCLPVPAAEVPRFGHVVCDYAANMVYRIVQ